MSANLWLGSTARGDPFNDLNNISRLFLEAHKYLNIASHVSERRRWASSDSTKLLMVRSIVDLLSSVARVENDRTAVESSEKAARDDHIRKTSTREERHVSTANSQADGCSYKPDRVLPRSSAQNTQIY